MYWDLFIYDVFRTSCSGDNAMSTISKTVANRIINAKVVGARTQMSVWELLTAMFVFEAVFGPAGLVAAPLFYAYIKKELMLNKLV